MSRSKQDLVTRVKKTARLVAQRMELRPRDSTRVDEAFALLTHGPPSNGAKQKAVYCHFLKQVNRLLGPAEVALCAIALGSTAVASLKDAERTELPHDIAKVRENLHQQVFLDLSKQTREAYDATSRPAADMSAASGNAATNAPPHHAENLSRSIQGERTGDVYELTLDEVRQFLTPQNVSGKIYLTEPWGERPGPHILINIEPSATAELIAGREPVLQ